MTTNQTANLGRHTVNRMGFGAMQLAGPGVFGPPREPDAARAVLRRAIELGVDHIDTSQYYGPDVVNELIHDALAPYPAGMRLVSKVGGRRDDAGGWLPALRPEELRAGVEENLATLGIESLAAVNLRLIGEPEVPLAEQLGTLEDLRREGKLDAIGLSNADRATVEEALELVDLACVQNAFSIVQRDSQDVLDLCAEHDIAFVPFFPLGSAFTDDNPVLGNPVIRRTAEQTGHTPAQIALAWTLSVAPNVLLIPGTSSVRHLEENTAVADIELDDETRTQLDDAAA
jgi:pyridoxine 4-dehydrogenase